MTLARFVDRHSLGRALRTIKLDIKRGGRSGGSGGGGGDADDDDATVEWDPAERYRGLQCLLQWLEDTESGATAATAATRPSLVGRYVSEEALSLRCSEAVSS